MIMEDMPERINVMKVISYTVADVVELLKSERTDDSEIEFGEVMERIEEWVRNDFSCGWGHEADPNELIYQDEDGNDLT